MDIFMLKELLDYQFQLMLYLIWY